MLSDQPDHAEQRQEDREQHQQRQTAQPQPARQIRVAVNVEIEIARDADGLHRPYEQHEHDRRDENDILGREKKRGHPCLP